MTSDHEISKLLGNTSWITNEDAENALSKCAEEKQRLLDIGAADDKTVFVLNHFSHNGKDVLYENFSKIAKDYGFEVSYDGMEIEV